MAVDPKTAKELVRRISDLQRAMRCIAISGSRGTATGVGLQGVLLFIGEGEFRATHLAARMGVGAPALSRYIGELEELGLVHRRPDPYDGRAQLVALTEAGRARLVEIEEYRAATLQELLREWSQRDAAEMAKALQKLADSLGESLREKKAVAFTPTQL